MQNQKKATLKTFEVSSIQPQIQVGGQYKEQFHEASIANVNKVFTTLKVTFPAWYEKYYGNLKTEQLAKRIWLTGVKKLTNEQVNQGLQRMILESDYPPKLKDFISLCLQVDQLPSLDVAWHEALTGVYSHQVVKIAAQLTGLFELRQASYDNQNLKKRFEYYLIQVISKFTKGELLAETTHSLALQSLLERLEQQAEQTINERIKEQGINAQNARAKCLAMLGIERSQQ